MIILEKLTLDDYLKMDSQEIQEVRQEVVARIMRCQTIAKLTADGVSSLSNDARKEARRYQADLKALDGYISNRFKKEALS